MVANVWVVRTHCKQHIYKRHPLHLAGGPAESFAAEQDERQQVHCRPRHNEKTVATMVWKVDTYTGTSTAGLKVMATSHEQHRAALCCLTDRVVEAAGPNMMLDQLPERKPTSKRKSA